jgi:hypothetical protein
VVAEDGRSAMLDEVHDGRHRPLRVRSIADIVAEQDDPLGALIACLRETRAKRLPVSVNVGKNCNQHGFGLTAQRWLDYVTAR